jgi:hypothetical protein
MRNILFTSLILFTSCLFLTACEKELPEDAVYDPRFPETDGICVQAKDLLKQADLIFMRDNYLVELYTQAGEEQGIKLVSNFDNAPENLTATYNIIRNKEGHIMYAAEFPYSESGDWENIYESVFNDKGDILVFVRKSSFFYNDANHSDVIVYEKSEYFYNSDQKLIKKTYQLKFGDKTEIPQGVKIDFQYRFPYKKYMTRKKWLKAHSLEK